MPSKARWLATLSNDGPLGLRSTPLAPSRSQSRVAHSLDSGALPCFLPSRLDEERCCIRLRGSVSREDRALPRFGLLRERTCGLSPSRPRFSRIGSSARLRGPTPSDTHAAGASFEARTLQGTSHRLLPDSFARVSRPARSSDSPAAREQQRAAQIRQSMDTQIDTLPCSPPSQDAFAPSEEVQGFLWRTLRRPVPSEATELRPAISRCAPFATRRPHPCALKVTLLATSPNSFFLARSSAAGSYRSRCHHLIAATAILMAVTICPRRKPWTRKRCERTCALHFSPVAP